MLQYDRLYVDNRAFLFNEVEGRVEPVKMRAVVNTPPSDLNNTAKRNLTHRPLPLTAAAKQSGKWLSPPPTNNNNDDGAASRESSSSSSQAPIKNSSHNAEAPLSCFSDEDEDERSESVNVVCLKPYVVSDVESSYAEGEAGIEIEEISRIGSGRRTATLPPLSK